MATRQERVAEKRWAQAIRLAEKDHYYFRDSGKKIVRRYLDKSDVLYDGAPWSPEPRLNLLWSNVQTLRPALYSHRPIPQITRRFKDRNPIGVWASQVLERATSVALETYDFNAVISSCVEDYLLPGRGVAWVRYEAEIVQREGGGEEVSYERVVCDYVNWLDFLHSPARTWNEVSWVGRRSYLTREELVERFGDRGRNVSLDAKPQGTKDDTAPEEQANIPTDRGVVWEIWDKTSRKVYFYAPSGNPKILEEGEPPLNYRDFFPCPRPLSATMANSSVIPVADFKLWQDQGEELDRLTKRIYDLASALRLRGLYNSSVEELSRVLDEADTNEMIPVANWSTFVGGGGFQGQIQFLPLQEAVANLQACYDARERVKQEVYEITGIADILRGQGDPGETASGVRLKGQFGSLRLRDRQQEVARFVRDIVALMAEVIAEQFSVQTLAASTGIELLPAEVKAAVQQGIQIPGVNPELAQRPSWQEVIGLLRNDQLRSFVIDIETDSTLQPDQELERRQRLEFLETVTGLIRDAAPLVQQAPEGGPLLGRLITYALRSFSAGAQFEDEIETTFQQIEQRAAQAQQGAGDQNAAALAAQQAQQQAAVEQAKIEAELARAQASQAQAQAAQVRAQAEVQVAQIEAQAKAVEAQLNQQRLLLEQQKLALEVREQELQNRRIELEFAQLPIQAAEVQIGGRTNL